MPDHALTLTSRPSSIRILPSLDRAGRAVRAVLAAGILQAFGVGLVVHLLHTGQHEAHELSPVLHWLRDSALAVPLSVAALAVGVAVVQRTATWASLPARGTLAQVLWSLTGALAYAAISVPGNLAHARLFGAEHAGMAPLAHAVHDSASVMLAAFSLLLALAAAGLRPWTTGAGATPRAIGLLAAVVPGSPRARVAVGTAAAVALLMAVTGGSPLGGIPTAAGDGPCPAGARPITY